MFNDDIDYLTASDKSILIDLLRLRASTLIAFEIESDRIGEKNLKEKIEDLTARGYVKTSEIDDILVFSPTWKTRWLRINGKI